MEDDWKARELFYRKVIGKYSEAIKAGEEKTVSGLKAWLVTCLADAAVARVSSEVASWEECVSFVSKIPSLHSGLEVSFWLTPSEVLEIGAGDGLDKSVFLQCLLKQKHIDVKIRVVELEGSFKHALVCFKQDLFVLIDVDKGEIRQGKSLEDLLANGFEGKKFLRSLYEFSQEEYVAF